MKYVNITEVHNVSSTDHNLHMSQLIKFLLVIKFCLIKTLRLYSKYPIKKDWPEEISQLKQGKTV